MRNWLRRWLGIADAQPAPLTRDMVLAALGSQPTPTNNAAQLDQLAADMKV